MEINGIGGACWRSFGTIGGLLRFRSPDPTHCWGRGQLAKPVRQPVGSPVDRQDRWRKDLPPAPPRASPVRARWSSPPTQWRADFSPLTLARRSPAKAGPPYSSQPCPTPIQGLPPPPPKADILPLSKNDPDFRSPNPETLHRPAPQSRRLAPHFCLKSQIPGLRRSPRIPHRQRPRGPQLWPRKSNPADPIHTSPLPSRPPQSAGL